MANTLKVTLVKSPIGAVPKHKKTVAAMGLTKMHKTVEMPDNAATRGMIQQVQHLVKVEEALICLPFSFSSLSQNLINRFSAKFCNFFRSL